MMALARVAARLHDEIICVMLNHQAKLTQPEQDKEVHEHRSPKVIAKWLLARFMPKHMPC